MRKNGGFEEELFREAIAGTPREIQAFSITGGEPFLYPERLLKILRWVSDGGRFATVVTNGLWSREWSLAEKLMEETYRFGLRGISISIDGYHIPKMPVDLVVCILAKARELGMAVNVRGAGKATRKTLAKIRKSGILAGQEKTEKLFDLDNIGEAVSLPADRLRKNRLKKCTALLGPFLAPDGTVYACCTSRIFDFNNPIHIRGNLRSDSIERILDRSSKDYLLAAIMSLGLPKIAHLAGVSIKTSDLRYQCEVCMSLFNNPVVRIRLEEQLSSSKELRKQIVGACMIYEACYKPDFLPQFQACDL